MQQSIQSCVCACVCLHRGREPRSRGGRDLTILYGAQIYLIHTHTHTHTHTHARTHTHTFLSVSLSVFLFHTHTHTHTQDFDSTQQYKIYTHKTDTEDKPGLFILQSNSWL